MSGTIHAVGCDYVREVGWTCEENCPDRLHAALTALRGELEHVAGELGGMTAERDMLTARLQAALRLAEAKP